MKALINKFPFVGQVRMERSCDFVLFLQKYIPLLQIIVKLLTIILIRAIMVSLDKQKYAGGL